MGRRKRLCIISTEKDEHSTTEGGDIPTEVPVPTEEHNSKQGDPIPTEGGARKKVRGCTKKTETWNMSSSQKIVVAFNKLNKPIGDEGNELTQYIGTIVRMAENVGIDIHDWRMVPEHKKEDMYSMAKFVFHPAETVEIRSWIIGDMGKKWRTWKGLLKERAFDESLSIDEIVEKHCEIDKRVNPTQFKTLVTQWFDEEYKDMCKMKTASRKKMEEPHVSGTKSFARLADEELLKNGVYPTRGQIYVKAHTRKQGKKVPEKVTQVLASLTAISSDSTTQDPFHFSNDDYFKVKGPEKRGGYIRCVGRMPTQKASSSTEDLSQMNLVGNKNLMNLVGYMASIIQDLAPNEDLSKILKNMNIQMPNRNYTVNQRSSESGFTCQGQPEESV